MKPVYQTVVDVQEDYGTCLVESSKGNVYPCGINRLNKNIKVGDKVQVTRSLSGEWIVVDVTHNYPPHLDITEFPRDEDGCLNWTEYCKYLDVIENMKPSERVRFDNHLRVKWEVSK